MDTLQYQNLPENKKSRKKGSKRNAKDYSDEFVKVGGTIAIRKRMKFIDKYVLNTYNVVWGDDAMRRTELIKLLERNGWYLKRNGGGHDIYTNGTEVETIPRHREIKENLAKTIIKRRDLK